MKRIAIGLGELLCAVVFVLFGVTQTAVAADSDSCLDPISVGLDNWPTYMVAANVTYPDGVLVPVGTRVDFLAGDRWVGCRLLQANGILGYTPLYLRTTSGESVVTSEMPLAVRIEGRRGTIVPPITYGQMQAAGQNVWVMAFVANRSGNVVTPVGFELDTGIGVIGESITSTKLLVVATSPARVSFRLNVYDYSEQPGRMLSVTLASSGGLVSTNCNISETGLFRYKTPRPGATEMWMQLSVPGVGITCQYEVSQLGTYVFTPSINYGGVMYEGEIAMAVLAEEPSPTAPTMTVGLYGLGPQINSAIRYNPLTYTFQASEPVTGWYTITWTGLGVFNNGILTTAYPNFANYWQCMVNTRMVKCPFNNRSGGTITTSIRFGTASGLALTGTWSTTIVVAGQTASGTLVSATKSYTTNVVYEPPPTPLPPIRVWSPKEGEKKDLPIEKGK